MGGGLVAFLTGLHPAIIFFAVLGGVALGLFIPNEIASRRLRKVAATTHVGESVAVPDTPVFLESISPEEVANGPR